MKKITLSLLLLLLTIVNTYGQIGVFESFNSNLNVPPDWTQTGFFNVSASQSCEGNSIRKNLYGTSPTCTLVTPNYVGQSNGTEISFSFDYKIVDWSAATVATPAGWGNFEVQLSTNDVDWTTYLIVNDDNHVVANTCATMSFTIPAEDVPLGSDLKFRFVGTWTSGDYYLYLDNISASQVTEFPPNCDALLTLPADGAVDVVVTTNLGWSAATGVASGYILSVGTTPGGVDIVNAENVGNTLSYDLPVALTDETIYYVNITPYNDNGNATGCSEFTFTTMASVEGDFCSNAVDLGALTSPLEGSTVGLSDDSNPSCQTNTAPDLFYSILVPSGSTITIGQTANDYDSKNYMFYGDCDNQTQIACFDDSDFTVTVWANDTGSDQTVYWVQDGYVSNSGTFTLAWSVVACTNPTATYTVVSDCGNGEQFNVDVEVTTLGSATSLTISDNQGTEPQQVTDVATATFGPYPNGTSVVFTVTNDQDADCFITSAAQTQTQCPPTNDTCEQAIDLTNLTSPLNATTTGATNDNLFVCNNLGESIANIYADTYFSILVPSGSTLNIGQTTNGYDSANIVFYGDCDNRTQIACFDDSDTTTVVWGNDTGSDQTVYWIQDGWSGTGDFTLAWSIINCANATAEFSVVSDCANGEQFNVNVNVTSLGSATSVTVSDDQGSEPQTITDVAELTFGPYPNNTPVVLTVVNDQDASCSVTSQTLNQTACPPVNDDFDDAIPVLCGESYTGNTTLATIDEADAPVGYGVTGTSRNVWYSYTGTGAEETVTLSLCSSLYDSAVLIYTGTSGDLTVIAGNDDGGDACPLAGTRSYVTFTSDGTSTYYIDLRGYTDFSSGAYTMAVSCAEVIPPAVENQTCDLALPIAVDGIAVESDNSYGTVNAVQPSCDNFGSIQDVWFSFVAPALGSVDCLVTNETMTSMNFNIYSGTCDALTALGGTCNANLTAAFTENLTGLVEGETYFIQVWSNSVEQGTFSVALTDINLGINEPGFAGFTYYPNPVKDVLNLSYALNISNVAVFNLLGQQVIAKTINASQSKVDMSHLSAGTYIVKVTAENQVRTIKVIKQ